MDRLVAAFFDQLLREICGEGERRLRLEFFSAALSALKGTRRALILVYFFCFLCFLAALSGLAAAFFAYEGWRTSAVPPWRDPRFLFFAAIFSASVLFLGLTARERRWVGAFQLEEKIAELENARPPSPSGPSGLSEEQVVALIDRALDKRFKKKKKAA
jgi:hypothetical protein